MMKNYQEQKHIILSKILDERSTAALSRKLGYSFDKVKRWQNGSKQFRWNEFCDLCFVTKVPLDDALAKSFGLLYEKKDAPYQIVFHLKIFLKIRNLKSFSHRMGVATSVLQRYLTCKTYPDVEFVLAMMDQRPQFLDLFLESIFPSETDLKSHVSLIDLPWAPAVASAASLPAQIRLKEFSSKWVGDFIGVSEAQVMQAIDLMFNLQLIEKQGPHYSPTLARTIGVRRETDHVKYAEFIRYWIRRAESRFANVQGTRIHKKSDLGHDAFRIFAASPESIEKVSQLMSNTEQEIHELLSCDDKEKTDVRVFLMHHFSTQDFKSSTAFL